MPALKKGRGRAAIGLVGGGGGMAMAGEFAEILLVAQTIEFVQLQILQTNLSGGVALQGAAEHQFHGGSEHLVVVLKPIELGLNHPLSGDHLGGWLEGGPVGHAAFQLGQHGIHGAAQIL